MREGDTSAGYFVSWSGGKDSCLAMARHRGTFGKPARLLTMLEETGTRTRGHHLRLEVVQAQAAALGTPLEVRNASWEGYEGLFIDALQEMRAEGVADAVFGDIDLDGHREWVERVCGHVGMVAHEPLWLGQRMELLEEFIDSGHVAVLVAVKEDALDPDLLGRRFDRALIGEFISAGIDASGELGEYHTVVVDGPSFSHPIELTDYGRISYDGYLFLDVAPVS